MSNSSGKNNEDLLEGYLHNYFSTDTYSIWKDKLNIDNISLITITHYVDKERGITDKAVVVELRNGQVIPHLFFEKDKILNRNREILFSMKHHAHRFFGWKITYSIPKIKRYSNGFNTDYIEDFGNRKTDGPSIEWDSKLKLFQIRIIDPEVY